MHTEQNAPHNHNKLCPRPRPLYPQTPHPTPSHEIIQAYLTQINPLWGVPTLITQKLDASHKFKNLLCHGCLAQQQLSKMV